MLEQGQSGSEHNPNGPGSSDHVSCPCGMNGTWIRASVVEVDEQWVALRVEEVLGGDPGLTVGQQTAGSYFGTHLCGGGCALPVQVGQQVLAVASPRQPDLPDCEARDECVDSCIESLPKDRPQPCFEPCITATEHVCPQAAEPSYADARIALSLWQDQVTLAHTPQASLNVSLEQLDLLWGDASTCEDNIAPSYTLPGYPGDTQPQPDEAAHCED